MTSNNFPFALSFDDILVIPDYFDGKSRDEIDLSTNICGVELKLPFISANMSAVSEKEMCEAMARAGGIGFLHRMMSVSDQNEIIAETNNKNLVIGATVGISRDDLLNINMFLFYGANIICLDVAHADQRSAIEFAQNVKKEYGDIPFVIGNIATADAAKRYIDALDPLINKKVALKASIGGGSLCSTRIRTAAGLPTFQACLDITSVIPDEWQLIADGGIKNSGDIVKSLLFADAVMMGSLFAGTDEAPGNVIIGQDRLKYKIYRGSASFSQKKDISKSGYIEGEETLVPYKGPVGRIIKGLTDGVRSGLSYGGSMNIGEFQNKARYVIISSAGHSESKPHLI